MAPGMAAATHTTVRRATRISQSALKQSPASVSLTSEIESASIPSVVAGAASGTTRRFARTPISES